MGAVRLVNGNNPNATSGRLEVFYEGQWGVVCSDGFGASAATVVCKQVN